MTGSVLVEEAPDVLRPDELLLKLNTKGCGAVVSFVGLTREHEGDADVLRLEFDAWHNKLTPVLECLATKPSKALASLRWPWLTGPVRSGLRSPSWPSTSEAHTAKKRFKPANGSSTN